MVTLLAMADYKKNSSNRDDWSEFDYSNKTIKNQRIAVRYVREDIAASVRKTGLFGIGLVLGRDIPVELLDISSKGVLIGSNKRFKVNKKIILTLKFEDSRIFRISSTIVRSLRGQQNQYGVKFDCLNNDLGDYLLKTQRILRFK